MLLHFCNASSGSSVKSVVEVQSWPTTFEVPEQCKGRFEFDDKKIMFKGVMTQSQKNALLENVKNNVEAKHKSKSFSLKAGLFTRRRHYRSTRLRRIRPTESGDILLIL